MDKKDTDYIEQCFKDTDLKECIKALEGLLDMIDEPRSGE